MNTWQNRKKFKSICVFLGFNLIRLVYSKGSFRWCSILSKKCVLFFAFIFVRWFNLFRAFYNTFFREALLYVRFFCFVFCSKIWDKQIRMLATGHHLSVFEGKATMLSFCSLACFWLCFGNRRHLQHFNFTSFAILCAICHIMLNIVRTGNWRVCNHYSCFSYFLLFSVVVSFRCNKTLLNNLIYSERVFFSQHKPFFFNTLVQHFALDYHYIIFAAYLCSLSILKFTRFSHCHFSVCVFSGALFIVVYIKYVILFCLW